jgi:membrane protein implicated in regulation of membrane protease activity
MTHDHGSVSYSGIDWPARLDPAITETIPVGNRALVVAVEGSLLFVKPA